MRPFTATGDDQPFPAMSAFQRTFFSALHSIGSPVADECPCRVGPRNSGHSSAAAQWAGTESRQTASTRRGMGVSGGKARARRVPMAGNLAESPLFPREERLSSHLECGDSLVAAL